MTEALDISKEAVATRMGYPADVDEYLVIASIRSGHHAVLHWACSQMPAPLVHVNNLLVNYHRKPIECYGCRRASKARHVVINLENFDLDDFAAMGLANRFRWVMIVVRDPFNWLASWRAARGTNKKLARRATKAAELRYMRHCLRSWYQHVEQVSGVQDRLPGERVVGVDYNRWFTDVEYRRELAGRLGVQFTDAGIDYVPKYGGGSSFEKLSDGRQLKPLDRWRRVWDDELYQAMLTKRARRYSREYFGFDPEVDA